MELYEEQLAPLLETLFSRGGVERLRPDGDFFERALHRASVREWGLGLERARSEEAQD
jgi:hypothetical protein